MLIPLYVLIGVWGGPRRLRATATFVIYTMAGSLLMLASIVVVRALAGDVLARRLGHVRQRVDLPRLPRRLRRQGADLPLPRLARRRLSRVAARGRGDPLRRRLEGGRLRAAADRDPELPRARRRLPGDDPRLRGGRASSTRSLLAFRAPDIRSVTAYSSMAQMSLIVLGLFSLTELGISGAILQSVAHGLVSATLFLLAGMVETRTGTSTFAVLGGMARGRPVLATVLMTTGIIALAVPGSVAFAGRVPDPRRRLRRGLGLGGRRRRRDRARGDVHAAPDLGRAAPGARRPTSATTSPDLRPFELALLVPLVRRCSSCRPGRPRSRTLVPRRPTRRL